VISLHSNATATGSTTVRGAEAYYISPNEVFNTRTYFPGFSYTTESRHFGNIILNHIDSTGIPRRPFGLRAENYAMIREVNVPAVLVENGFHTNPFDRSLLMDPVFMDNLAVAYRNAILQYFN
jgi:N-acetylmuramoyl-L-alanine amidase